MSISKLPNSPTTVTPTEQAAFFSFNNGDLQAVNGVMEKYQFIDEQSMFRFALAILLKAEGNGVYIDEGDNKRTFISPSSQIIKQNSDNHDEQTP
ncbi:MAG: hypothetical protein G01um101413_147 [Parcubacteria group bacterium Gr01-1014_13]|nr:MAG: hypothetical protein G01um101413_147 [Parcubacteria group bacterium Gr01-1014_13]